MATYKFKTRSPLGTRIFGADQVKNWADIEMNLTRDQTYKGVIRSFTNTFEFVDSAKNDIFLPLLDEYGADAELYLVIEVGNDNKERSSFKSLAFGREFKADFSTAENDGHTFKINFVDSDFEGKLFSRDDQKVNYNTDLSIDGDAISTPILKQTILHDRTIYLSSEVRQSTLPGFTPGFTPGTYEREYVYGWDLNYNTIPDVKDSPIAYGDGTINSNEKIETYLFLQSEEQTVINLSGSLDVLARSWHSLTGELGLATGFTELQFQLRIARHDANFNFIDNVFESDIITLTPSNTSESKLITITESIQLEEGQSLKIVFYVKTATTEPNVGIKLTYGDDDFIISINKISYKEQTTSDIIPPHELFSRLAEIYTGKQNAFYSDVFGRTDLGYSKDGEWAYLGVANGKMIRGFAFADNPLNTSLKEAFQSYDAVLNLGAAIETIDGQQKLRIEPYSYFFDSDNIQDIGSDVSGVNRSNNSDLMFTEINCGYKDQEYEEVNGLDSFNGAFTFSTPLKVKNKKYGIESKYRADDYGIEFARRKAYATSATEDTRYDKDIFLIDCELLDGIIQAVRATDFTTVSGILEPSNAYNLRISPKRNLLRHGNVIKAGLVHKIDDLLIYVKGANNNNLSTQLTTETTPLVESSDVLIGDLSNPVFLSEIIDVEAPYNRTQWDELIINKNKMIKFVYKNKTIYGFIDDIKYNLNEEKATFSLLRANR